MLYVSAFNLPLQWIFLRFISLVSVKKSSELHWCLLPACILLATQIHHVTLTSDHTAKNVRTLSSFPLAVYDLYPQVFLEFYHKKSWFSHAAEWGFSSRPSRPCANLYHFSKATGRYRILNKPNMQKNQTVNGAKHLKLSSGSSEWVIQDGIIHQGVIQWVIPRGSFRKGHSRGLLVGSFVVEVTC